MLIGLLYLLGALAIVLLAVRQMPYAYHMTTFLWYAVIGAALILVVLGVGLMSHASAGDQAQQSRIARLRAQVRQRRQELSQH